METADSLELELVRFSQCHDGPARFILWAAEDPIQVRRWVGEACCGDMLTCYDGVDRIRLCERCAESPWLRNRTARMLYKAGASLAPV
jgi:hypothetical protein